jgi:membrane-bound metal-dependent hydrolase YbcI (DUF457 family)
MFIGHHAVGFAAKRFAPRTSLGLLMAAPLLLDFLWPLFLLLGIEQMRVQPANPPFLRLDLYHYPWSHSLLMSVVWSVLAGGAYWLFTRYRAGALAIGVGVFSHWVLDFVTHVPDMAVYPGGPKVGLGLWQSTAATIVVESTLFVIGVLVYLRSTRARDRVGSISLWAFLALLVFAYASSIASPPPADYRILGAVGLASILFQLWVHWFDRHRTPVTSPGAVGVPA